MKRILVTGLLGGIVLFVWGGISWMVLPWHNYTMDALPNADNVAAAMMSANLEKGVYLYPMADESATAEMTDAAEPAEHAEAEAPEMAAEETEPAHQEGEEAAAAGGEEPQMEGMVASKEGAMMPAEEPATSETESMAGQPYMFILYSPDGIDPSDPMPFVGGFILNVLTACLAAYLLTRVAGNFQSFGQRVGFVVMIGVFSALVSHITAWNWFQFPTDYSLLMSLDLVIGWVLAGLVLAWRIQPEQAAAA